MKGIKRKITDNNNFNKNDFISPSQLTNYFLKDTLIDYLDYYKINKIDEIPNHLRTNSINDGEFTKFIKLKGIDFEKKIINELKIPVYSINDSISIESFNKTINAINNKHPIIYQGVLIDFKNKTYGRPDIIIRGDYLKIIYDINCNFSSYYIIDIKYSTIYLSSDEKYILNNDFIPSYKAQVFLYTRMLNNILNQNEKKGFILGKKYIYTKSNIKNISSVKLALIDYQNKDIEYTYLLDKAINWIIRLRNEGINWILLPKPSIDELYPNMSNNKDDKWRPLKKELANKIKELTLIVNVGYKERIKAFSKNIYSYDNINCNSSSLGLTGKTGLIVDNIININKIDCQEIIKPKKIKSEYWRQVKDNQFEFFIDYETTNDFEDDSLIFMIGVGYIIENNWNFKCFVSIDNTIESQKNMFGDFWNHINNISLNKEPIFIHWTSAEPIFYKKMQNKILDLPNKTFLDLYKVFIDEPIVIKDALNYSLKTIAKAMHKHNLIKTLWDSNSKCCNGLDALIQAHKIYFINDQDKKNMDDIIIYNEIDCKVLYEIIDYLRKNH